MLPTTNLPASIADAAAIEWAEHPRIKNVFVKTLLTAADNPLANVNLVKIPVGGEVTRHLHPQEVETIYLLQGRGTLVLGQVEIPFRAGQAAAIPQGLEHALRNEGAETIELIAFFTPPIT
jgi:quercetin dioxygenase-like cupin family protein